MDENRAADAYGCMDGHATQQVDAELPKEKWSDGWDERSRGKPVCPLLRPLYGHPHAGAHWDNHAEERLKQVGFHLVSEAWPSVYSHEEHKLMLVRYVDDFKCLDPLTGCIWDGNFLRETG